MENNRKDNLSSQCGVALITVLIISLCSLALMGGVFYMLKSGLRVATINKQFTTAKEASAGGIEYGVAIVKAVISHDGNLPDDLQESLGIPSSYEEILKENIYLCKNSDNPSELPRPLKLDIETQCDYSTGQNCFNLKIIVQCLYSIPIPGSESLVFPPPPGGTKSNPPQYVFYRIRSIAKEQQTNNTADIEAVYRITR